MSLVNSYVWRNCDGSDSIFVDTNFSAPSDYVYYKGECYFNTYVEVQIEDAINPLNGDFFNSCVECHNSTTFVSIPCSLYGQIDIYLSGNIELVLEGGLEGPQLKGQIDIELQGMVDIYLQGLMNDPLLNAELEYTVGLEACVVQAEPSATPTLTPTPTPTPSQPCPNCDQYLAVNNDTVNILTVRYVSCDDYNTYTFTVNPDDSKPICSCSEPTPGRDNVSTDYEFINQGTCGISPTPSNTPTNTPTPTGSAQLNYYFATKCCEPGTAVVSVSSGATLLETYATDDNYCYQLLSVTSDTPTVNAIYIIDGCDDCMCPSATLTPTPTITPTTTPACLTCDQYNITNSDTKISLNIIYNNCITGQNVGATVIPNSSIQVCSCTLPYRTAGSTSFTITNNGDCP